LPDRETRSKLFTSLDAGFLVWNFTMMRLETRTDPDAETVLSFANVEYVIKEVCLEDVDWGESANNCARLWNPLNEEKIDDYRMAMVAGDIFPMPVMEAGKGGLIVLGGNQRMNAAKRIDGSMSLMAYVARPLLTSQREVVIRSLNARHGWGSEKDERMDHAVYLVQRHGMTTDDASRMFMVAKASINLRIKADETKAKLAKRGIDASRLSQAALAAIGSVQDEKYATAVAKAAVETSATGEQVTDAAKSIIAAKSTAAKAKIIKDFAKVWGDSIKLETKSKGMRRPRREKFLRHMQSMSTFLEHGNDGEGFHSLDDLQCTENDREKVEMLCNKITVRLNVIRGA
jgi:hypothetical protein